MKGIVTTSHGRIAVEQTSGTGISVLLLHGNSTCNNVFENQLKFFGKKFHFVAVDLPGHGQSDNALNPDRTYTIPGYADVILELADILNLGRFIVYGWSLGGHIAIEMMARSELAGVIISGTPPIDRGVLSVLRGYRLTKLTSLFGKEILSERQCRIFATTLFGGRPPAYLLNAVRRTDGASRSIMMRGIKSRLGVNQKKTVELSHIPFAIIDGANDPFIRHKYISKNVHYKNLWRGDVQIITDAGHTPFLQSPNEFNQIFSEFLLNSASSSCVT